MTNMRSTSKWLTAIQTDPAGSGKITFVTEEIDVDSATKHPEKLMEVHA